jgi:hypothetical protein
MIANINSLDAFPHGWSVEVLKTPPMIAPVRQFTYPQEIAGEEDALARGALLLMVRPEAGGTFLATCALGFTDPTMPTGVFACPDPREICAVAGGYGYIIDTSRPERSTHLPLKPVAEVRVLAGEGLLLFVGFHTLLAWGANGVAWETRRLSWEGLRLGEVKDGVLHGFGWNLITDREVAFTVYLATGVSEGGAYTQPNSRSL